MGKQKKRKEGMNNYANKLFKLLGVNISRLSVIDSGGRINCL
jgi:hypothetical protein